MSENRSERVLQLVKGIKPSRFTDTKQWLIVGHQIERFGEFGKEAYDYWKTHNPTTKNAEELLEEYIDNLTMSKYAPSILYEWFRIDNSKAYREFLCNYMRDDIFGYTSDSELAMLFYNLCPNKYICVEGKGWFCLNSNNVWEFQPKIPASISTDITENFYRVINESERSLTNAKERARDEGHTSKSDLIKSLESQSESLVKLNKKLGSASTVRNIKEFLPSLYKDDKVFDKMDANRYLFACENKVFDLKKKEWRKIQPEDYISITTGYEYEEPKADKKVEKEVEAFLRSCFKTEEEYIYFLITISRTFLGTRDDRWSQKFYIWTGSGSNGKSLISNFVNSVLGNYYHQISPSTLTLPPSKVDGANTQIAPASKKRAIFSSEPTTSDKSDGAFSPRHKLQQSTIKMLTGGEPINARDNYQKGSDVKPFLPMFGLFLLCNTIPDIDLDDAILRRLEVLHFPFKFVPKSKEYCLENEKPACSKIGSLIKTKEYILAFLHILTDTFIKNLSEDIQISIPESVKQYSNNYLDTQKKVSNWFFENYKPVEDVSDRKLWIKGMNLFDQYKRDTKDDISDIKFYKDLEFGGLTFTVEKSQGNTKTLKGYERKPHDCKNHSECKGDTLFGDYCVICRDKYNDKKAKESSTLKDKPSGHNPELTASFGIGRDANKIPNIDY